MSKTWTARSSTAPAAAPAGPPAPLCKCGDPCRHAVSQKQNQNAGRQYFTCKKWKDDGACGFFVWVDEFISGNGREKGSFGDMTRQAHNAGVTRNHTVKGKIPIDTQVVGYGDVDPILGVQQPVFMIKIPADCKERRIIDTLSNIQGVAPLHVDTAEGIRLFKFSDTSAVDKSLQNLHDICDVVRPPTCIFKCVTSELQRIRPTHDWNNCKIPKSLYNIMMPFQRAGVEYAVSRGGRVLIGDEMGLGKTIQAIALMSNYVSEWPALVICPSGIKLMWQKSILKFLRYLDPAVVQVVDKGKDPLTGKVIVVSYDIVHKPVFTEKLNALNPQVVILDEAHAIKSHDSQRAQKLRPILKNCSRLVLLTGTPVLNRPIELFNLVDAIIRTPQHVFCHKQMFGNRYCDLKKNHFGRLDWKGHSNLAELQYLLRLTNMIRREKDAVLDQLPAKIRTEIHLSITDSEKKLLDADLKKMKDRFRSLDDIDNAGLTGGGSSSMMLFTATSKAKQKPVCEYIEESCTTGEKYLIFAHHIHMLDAVEKCVSKICETHNNAADFNADEGMWSHIRLDGSSSGPSRDTLVEDFQSNTCCKYAVLSIMACGTGLTLTASSNVIFAELFWTPGQLVQAEDRVHRFGQKNCCNIKYLLAKDTSDDVLWPMVNRKLAVLGAALNTKSIGAEQKNTWTEEVKEFQRGHQLPLGNGNREKAGQASFSSKVEAKKSKGASGKQSNSNSSKNKVQTTLDGFIKTKPTSEEHIGSNNNSLRPRSTDPSHEKQYSHSSVPHQNGHIHHPKTAPPNDIVDYSVNRGSGQAVIDYSKTEPQNVNNSTTSSTSSYQSSNNNIIEQQVGNYNRPGQHQSGGVINHSNPINNQQLPRQGGIINYSNHQQGQGSVDNLTNRNASLSIQQGVGGGVGGGGGVNYERSDYSNQQTAHREIVNHSVPQQGSVVNHSKSYSNSAPPHRSIIDHSKSEVINYTSGYQQSIVSQQGGAMNAVNGYSNPTGGPRPEGGIIDYSNQQPQSRVVDHSAKSTSAPCPRPVVIDYSNEVVGHSKVSSAPQQGRIINHSKPAIIDYSVKQTTHQGIVNHSVPQQVLHNHSVTQQGGVINHSKPSIIDYSNQQTVLHGKVDHSVPQQGGGINNTSSAPQQMPQQGGVINHSKPSIIDYSNQQTVHHGKVDHSVPQQGGGINNTSYAPQQMPQQGGVINHSKPSIIDYSNQQTVLHGKVDHSVTQQGGGINNTSSAPQQMPQQGGVINHSKPSIIDYSNQQTVLHGKVDHSVPQQGGGINNTSSAPQQMPQQGGVINHSKPSIIDYSNQQPQRRVVDHSAKSTSAPCPRPAVIDYSNEVVGHSKVSSAPQQGRIINHSKPAIIDYSVKQTTHQGIVNHSVPQQVLHNHTVTQQGGVINHSKPSIIDYSNQQTVHHGKVDHSVTQQGGGINNTSSAPQLMPQQGGVINHSKPSIIDYSNQQPQSGIVNTTSVSQQGSSRPSIIDYSNKQMAQVHGHQADPKQTFDSNDHTSGKSVIIDYSQHQKNGISHVSSYSAQQGSNSVPSSRQGGGFIDYSKQQNGLQQNGSISNPSSRLGMDYPQQRGIINHSHLQTAQSNQLNNQSKPASNQSTVVVDYNNRKDHSVEHQSIRNVSGGLGRPNSAPAGLAGSPPRRRKFNLFVDGDVALSSENKNGNSAPPPAPQRVQNNLPNSHPQQGNFNNSGNKSLSGNTKENITNGNVISNSTTTNQQVSSCTPNTITTDSVPQSTLPNGGNDLRPSAQNPQPVESNVTKRATSLVTVSKSLQSVDTPTNIIPGEYNGFNPYIAEEEAKTRKTPPSKIKADGMALLTSAMLKRRKKS